LEQQLLCDGCDPGEQHKGRYRILAPIYHDGIEIRAVASLIEHRSHAHLGVKHLPAHYSRPR
jgi:hypothetical protein